MYHPILSLVTSQVDIEYSLHDFLGSHRLGSQTLSPTKFAEINLMYRDINGQPRNADFIVGEEDLDGLIGELEDALAIVDKIEMPR